MALQTLGECHLPTDGYRSKDWNEFAAHGAPPLDFVFTVCDNAAGEICPIWPGQPMSAHWGIEDPAAVEGDGQSRAFVAAFHALKRRIGLFLTLPMDSIDEMSLRRRLGEIGKNANQVENAG
jgi:arsenate reductase